MISIKFLLFTIIILFIFCIIIIRKYPEYKYGGNSLKRPKVGDKVIFHIKPYIGEYHEGTVVKVLTKKKKHTRGHKVKLDSGYIGRITCIL